MPVDKSESKKIDISPPKMDKLSSKSFQTNARLPYNRSVGSFNESSRNPSKETIEEWWNGLVAKELQRLEAEKRSADLVRLEKEMGLSSVTPMLQGEPKSTWEDLKVGTEQGLTSLGQLAAGIGSMMGVPGSEKRRQLYEERGRIMDAYRRGQNVPIFSQRKSNALELSPGDIANKLISYAPELYNPVNKPGLAAKAANTVWHALRGYAPNKSVEDAAVAVGSHIIGEKAEDLATSGKGLIGNIAGAFSEETYKKLTE